MNRMSAIPGALALLLATAWLPAAAADAGRQADVARRGAEVMPFRLERTVHVFTSLPDGGVQRVVARDADDAAQVRLVRQHLRELQARFRAGDFSGPAQIHGQDMPGLAELRQAKRGSLAIDYRQVRGGAELVFRTGDAALVQAVHAWFDAQLSDHGHDAMEGHAHGHSMPSKP